MTSPLHQQSTYPIKGLLSGAHPNWPIRVSVSIPPLWWFIPPQICERGTVVMEVFPTELIRIKSYTAQSDSAEKHKLSIDVKMHLDEDMPLFAKGVFCDDACVATEVASSTCVALTHARAKRANFCLYIERLSFVSHHAERISIASVKGVNRAILDRRAKLASELSRRA